MLKLRKTTPAEPLIVSMTGLRLGDRLLIVGGSDARRVARLAVKPGLTGRVCWIDEDAGPVAEAVAAAAREGVLVETATAPLTAFPFERHAFDVVLLNRVFARLPADRQIAVSHEAARVIRDGGRAVVIENAPRSGLGALFGGGASLPSEEVERILSSAAFRGVRTLAVRDGLVFVEGGVGGAGRRGA